MQFRCQEACSIESGHWGARLGSRWAAGGPERRRIDAFGHGWMARCVIVLSCVLPGMVARAALPADLPTIAPMIEAVTPSVVNIATYTTVQVRNPLFDDPFFRRFFNVPDRGRQVRRTRSAGSGVVIDARKGHVVTNYHVIDRADEITVTLADGRTLTAVLIGSDAQVDLAVLKIDPDELTAVALADSDQLRVGDFVVAIGNPFGLNQTVTSGIVSALGRSGLGIEGYEDFIQTDASINPGNSGGALVNLAGELVGINTAILAPSGGNVGIGFAIPANMVTAIVDQLVEFGEVRRGDPGMAVQELNPELARAFGVDLRRGGVVVVEIEPDSAADKAGLQPGDVIVRFGKRDIRRPTDYFSQQAVLMVGDDVSLRYLRDGRERRATLRISEDSFERVPGERLDPRLDGAMFQNYRNGGLAAGVAVVESTPGTRAWRYGLRVGDVVVAANQQPVADVSELTRVAKRERRRLVLRVFREGEFGFIVVQ